STRAESPTSGENPPPHRPAALTQQAAQNRRPTVASSMRAAIPTTPVDCPESRPPTDRGRDCRAARSARRRAAPAHPQYAALAPKDEEALPDATSGSARQKPP